MIKMTDTFPPIKGENEVGKSRVELAAKRHAGGYNCCQAVVCTYCDLLGMDEVTAFRASEGFGLGIAGMQETCGSVCAMVFWRASGTATPTCKSLQPNWRPLLWAARWPNPLQRRTARWPARCSGEPMGSLTGCAAAAAVSSTAPDCGRDPFPGKFAAYEGPEDESQYPTKGPAYSRCLFRAGHKSYCWSKREVGAFVSFFDHLGHSVGVVGVHHFCTPHCLYLQCGRR